MINQCRDQYRILDQIKEEMANKSLNDYKLCQMTNISSSHFNYVMRGIRPLSRAFLDKINSVLNTEFTLNYIPETSDSDEKRCFPQIVAHCYPKLHL